MRYLIMRSVLVLAVLLLVGTAFASAGAAPAKAMGAASISAMDDSAATTTYVYITKTGEKYHRGTCRYLKKSKIKVTLEDAKKRGYTPCKVCKPPK